jgi:hypothetical protein
MKPSEPITHPVGRYAGNPPTRPLPEPSACRLLVEPLNLIETVPVAGPPAILIVAPLVLSALVLAGPFLALLTVVVALMAVAVLVALVAALVASPCVLVRSLRRRHMEARRSLRAPAPRMVRVYSRRAAA